MATEWKPTIQNGDVADIVGDGGMIWTHFKGLARCSPKQGPMEKDGEAFASSRTQCTCNNNNYYYNF